AKRLNPPHSVSNETPPRKVGLKSSSVQPRHVGNVNLALGVPGVVSCLHPKPDSRTVPKHLAEAGGSIRRNRLLLTQDVVELLARNAEQFGNLHLGLSRRRDDVI